MFINYRVDRGLLQRQVPFELELYEDEAYVSLVAFTLVRMRPRLGGFPAELLFRPIATHEFLNVRTYVRDAGEPGIFFLAEWLSNRISVQLGPRIFGLPYQFGHLCYEHPGESDRFRGKVEARDGKLEYQGSGAQGSLAACEPGSLSEFMLERYTAFTQRRKRRRLFRIWHEPWPQTAVSCQVGDTSLIASSGPWWKSAQLVSANSSPGVDVLMGRPHRIA